MNYKDTNPHEITEYIYNKKDIEHNFDDTAHLYLCNSKFPNRLFAHILETPALDYHKSYKYKSELFRNLRYTACEIENRIFNKMNNSNTEKNISIVYGDIFKQALKHKKKKNILIFYLNDCYHNLNNKEYVMWLLDNIHKLLINKIFHNMFCMRFSFNSRTTYSKVNEFGEIVKRTANLYGIDMTFNFVRSKGSNGYYVIQFYGRYR